MSKTTLIIDPITAGHHLRYVGWISSAFLAKGDRVIIAIVNGNHKLDLAKYIDIENEGISFLDLSLTRSTLKGALGLILNDLYMYRFLRKAITRVSPDQVFLPYIDSCILSLALLGLRQPFTAITMRTNYHQMVVLENKKLSFSAKIREFLICQLLKQVFIIF